jgi:catechol 2,3-dioxygenase-like lactoylglutathione lyase family enzyme
MGSNISKIHKVAIVTDDLKGTEEFYTKVLGLEVMERFPANTPGDEYIFLRAGDIILELMPTEAGPIGFHHISFLVEDPDKEMENLKTQGVKCTMEPKDVGFGIHIGFFEGPNGVKLQLFNRKVTG